MIVLKRTDFIYNTDLLYNMRYLQQRAISNDFLLLYGIEKNRFFSFLSKNLFPI